MSKKYLKIFISNALDFMSNINNLFCIYKKFQFRTLYKISKLNSPAFILKNIT